MFGRSVILKLGIGVFLTLWIGLGSCDSFYVGAVWAQEESRDLSEKYNDFVFNNKSVDVAIEKLLTYRDCLKRNNNSRNYALTLSVLTGLMDVAVYRYILKPATDNVRQAAIELINLEEHWEKLQIQQYQFQRYKGEYVNGIYKAEKDIAGAQAVEIFENYIVVLAKKTKLLEKKGHEVSGKIALLQGLVDDMNGELYTALDGLDIGSLERHANALGESKVALLNDLNGLKSLKSTWEKDLRLFQAEIADWGEFKKTNPYPFSQAWYKRVLVDKKNLLAWYEERVGMLNKKVSQAAENVNLANSHLQRAKIRRSTASAATGIVAGGALFLGGLAWAIVQDYNSARAQFSLPGVEEIELGNPNMFLNALWILSEKGDLEKLDAFNKELDLLLKDLNC